MTMWEVNFEDLIGIQEFYNGRAIQIFFYRHPAEKLLPSKWG